MVITSECQRLYRMTTSECLGHHMILKSVVKPPYNHNVSVAGSKRDHDVKMSGCLYDDNVRELRSSYDGYVRIARSQQNDNARVSRSPYDDNDRLLRNLHMMILSECWSLNRIMTSVSENTQNHNVSVSGLPYDDSVKGSRSQQDDYNGVSRFPYIDKVSVDVSMRWKR